MDATTVSHALRLDRPRDADQMSTQDVHSLSPGRDGVRDAIVKSRRDDDQIPRSGVL